MSGRHLAFPFRIGSDGRSATPESLDAHIRGEILQLLLSNSGERPFLPGFGGNLRRLVFQGNNAVTAGLTKAGISQALANWLGHRVRVLSLDVVNDEATLAIDLTYQVIDSGEQRRLRFERGGGV
ncbi:phage baseplate assembly protein W [Tahibacter aquaticus]|uniref:Phage baseplate assembly protein W n=1 Tax=Tahibacter aquaticus TaxID=520092 RepID=A0A4R6Z037_9GAMM|nr:GPW/gp25 family protein [Tahibacter aquaticus]TDR44865.1 phage baseplate assembly protein W [Tahibacter aquaticus]